MSNPITFLERTQKDTIYFHEAMSVDDRKLFIQAIVKEMYNHIKGKHCHMIEEVNIPRINV